MSGLSLAVQASAMVTGVGLDAPSSCAAIRAGIDNFQETAFLDAKGEPLMACVAPVLMAAQGLDREAGMLAMVLEECVAGTGLALEGTPVLLCLSEAGRPDRADSYAEQLRLQAQSQLGLAFHPESAVFQYGRVGALVALRRARQLIYQGGASQVVIAAVDSLLSPVALQHFEAGNRLLTSQNSDGFIPGEGASALVLGRPVGREGQTLCLGLGFGAEPAPIGSGRPLRADGLVRAIAAALDDAGESIDRMDCRLVDVSGEQYGFKESSLAMQRIVRRPKDEFDIWHPADCVGEIGAAIGPLILGVADTALRQGYSPGQNFLCHFSNADDKRAAAVMAYRAGRDI